MTMTDDRMALLELIEKRADADLVRTMLAFAAERLMTVEVEDLTGAPAGVRSPERLNHRNGYRERVWDTRAGRIDLAIPKLGEIHVAPAIGHSAFTRTGSRPNDGLHRACSFPRSATEDRRICEGCEFVSPQKKNVEGSVLKLDVV
jgi:hypothetical protein